MIRSQEIGLANLSGVDREFGMRIGTLVFIFLVVSAQAKSPEKGQSVDYDMRVREQMVVISRQLGVTCTYCHKLENFRDKSLPPYQVSLAHMKMVEELNSKKVKGLPKVDCFMCHRGVAKPDYREKK